MIQKILARNAIDYLPLVATLASRSGKRRTVIVRAQYFSKLSHPLWDKTALPLNIWFYPSIRGRNGHVFPSGSGCEHKNGTILSTTEIIPAICGENPKPEILKGVIISL
jgi:hypothetical protein